MLVKSFVENLDADFYCGVPDSQLRALCDYLIKIYGTDPQHHIIAANEGNCTAIAAGYHLATGKVPVVYLQNSGEGNIINPIASLLNDRVYAIPCIFVIGWRGEPGVHDEPQHVYQGEVTIKLLQDMDIATFVVDKYTTVEELDCTIKQWKELLRNGKQVAFVVKKNALENSEDIKYRNDFSMNRETIIRSIVHVAKEDVIISTTGKASRELFEMREAEKQSHCNDFLTVGSMGHSSSIALGVALNSPLKKVWCIDGDGAALMHMGAMALIGANKPKNLIHVLINNGAHETVGGMPTVATEIDFVSIAKACGYQMATSVDIYSALDKELKTAKRCGKLCFIEAKCALGSRGDLGRPTTTAIENKNIFMENLRN